MLRSNDVGKLAHEISANWLETFKSNNLIIDHETKLASNFTVKGRGILSEFSSNRNGKHFGQVASASVNGDFDIMGNTSEEIIPFQLDFERLRQIVESMKLLGETGYYRESNRRRKRRILEIVDHIL